METITKTKDRRLEALPVDGGALVLRVMSANESGVSCEVVLLTRAEIAALAAKFPVEEK